VEIQRCMAIILLNYNSEEDLFVCTKQINKQVGVDLITIVVDNASCSKCVKNIKTWENIFEEKPYSGSKKELFDLIENNKLDGNTFSTFFIYNDENKGYSAGNNIGIKLADYLGVDAVLIANPDMRFENEKYIYELSKVLFSNQKYFIAASRIIGLDGKDQNPWREAEFTEELLWPLWLVWKKSYAIDYPKDNIVTVPKVCGCCFMAKMDFLREIGYFDENTFLYSEEPILSAQVKEKQGAIVFTPVIEAIHAHKKSEKENSSKRMLLFIKSRKYYLKKYSGYNRIKLLILNLSYAVLALLHKIKIGVNR